MEHGPAHTPQPHLLGDILPAPGTLVARCLSQPCGAVTRLQISPNLHRRLRLSSLSRLQANLRCTCGARSGALEPWPASVALLPCKDRLYLFLI
jgi:hypothetical protein